MPVSVIVADETFLSCQTLSRELERCRYHFSVPACALNSKDLLKKVGEYRPDIAIISPNLQDGPLAGFQALRELRASRCPTRAIMLLDHSDDSKIIGAFAGGAGGVFCRTDSLEALSKCILCVSAGQIWANNGQLKAVMSALAERKPLAVVDAKGLELLTRREDQVVSMVVEGLTNREISSRLRVSEHTIKNHLFHVYEKLGISSRVELVLYAFSNRSSPGGRFLSS